MIKNSHIWLITAAVLLLSVQLLAVVIYVYSFVPLVWDDSFLKGLEPTRDALFYVIFLTLNIILMAAAVKLVLPQLASPSKLRKFKLWLWLESLWCFLILFCFFKWTTYRYPFWNVLHYENQAWLRFFFCAVCGLAALSKIFFHEISIFLEYLQLEAAKEQFLKRWLVLLQAGFIGTVVLLLFIPNTHDVAASALFWDQWNHLDQVTGWFIKHGWYINYEQTISMLIVGAMAYIIILFYFIHAWLGSWLLAAAGSFLAIKMGMFYYEASPCIWINPSNTFLAHGWDILFIFILWRLSRTPKKFYAVAIGAGTVLIVAWIISGGYISVFGLDNQPMMAPLRVRQFFPFFMGYFLPVFYVFSLLAAQDRLVTVLCIYGLMIFVNYIERPAIGYYGSLMVPAILVFGWWLKRSCAALSLKGRRGVYGAVLLLAAGALLTNRLMLVYPNLFFQDKERFSRERNVTENFNDISKSASLIRQLTREDQKVVLVSNFETALLMQAHRRPIFKEFPVMFSSGSTGPGGLRLKTKKQALDLIDSMSAGNPLYAFVDQRLWVLAPETLDNTGLSAVLAYLRNHYKEYAAQGFVVALKQR